LADHDSEAQLAAGSTAPGQALNAGGSQVAAAIVTEIRARREGLADDERRARRHPRSRQLMTRRGRQMEGALIDGLLLALTHATGKPYDIGAAELLISKGAGQ
jgi:hypothetical protein